MYLDISSVPDEGYSRNATCALNVISTFLFGLKTRPIRVNIFVEGISQRYISSIILIQTVKKIIRQPPCVRDEINPILSQSLCAMLNHINIIIQI